MTTQSWIETVEIGEALELFGPDGIQAHDASLAEAYDCLEAIRFTAPSGRLVSLKEVMERGTTYLDITRVR